MARSISLRPVVSLPPSATIDATVLHEALGRSRQSIYYLRIHAGFPNAYGKKSGSSHYDTAAVVDWLRSRGVKINWI